MHMPSDIAAAKAMAAAINAPESFNPSFAQTVVAPTTLVPTQADIFAKNSSIGIAAHIVAAAIVEQFPTVPSGRRYG